MSWYEICGRHERVKISVCWEFPEGLQVGQKRPEEGLRFRQPKRNIYRIMMAPHCKNDTQLFLLLWNLFGYTNKDPTPQWVYGIWRETIWWWAPVPELWVIWNATLLSLIPGPLLSFEGFIAKLGFFYLCANEWECWLELLVFNSSTWNSLSVYLNGLIGITKPYLEPSDSWMKL